MSARPQDDRNQEATVYLGNLDERCTDALVWELMLQAGPVANVHLPKDRISMAHQGYGFCEFLTEEDAEYACKIMNQIKLWGKPIRVNKASSDKKQLDVGANLFIGNLDENVDERLLYDTFSRFGIISTTAKIARDPSTGLSKGYGFVSYTDFESADGAIEQMNNQFLMNKAITVQYAFKKDGKGERHGTPAERLLAAQAKKNNALPAGARPPPAPMGFGAPPMGMGMGAPPMGAPMQMGGQMGMPPPPPMGFGAPAMMGQPPQMPPQQQPGQYGMPPPPPGFTPQQSPSMMPPPPPGFGGATPQFQPQFQQQPGMPMYPNGGPPMMGMPPLGMPMGMPMMGGMSMGMMPPPPPGFQGSPAPPPGFQGSPAPMMMGGASPMPPPPTPPQQQAS